MSEVNRVVAHFLDGRVVKGTTRDFSPDRHAFHLFRDGSGTQVRYAQLKAVFFVRDFEGDSQRNDLQGFIAGPRETVHGRKIAVLFPDGELVCGYSLSYSPYRNGFFMYPADAGSNNERIYVNFVGAEVAEDTAAEELAQRVLDSRAA